MKYCGEYQGSVRTTTSRVYVKNTAALAPMHVRICASIPCSPCAYSDTMCKSLLVKECAL